MAATVSLHEVVEELESLTEESAAYLNRETGEIYSIRSEEADMVEDEFASGDVPEWLEDEPLPHHQASVACGELRVQSARVVAARKSASQAARRTVSRNKVIKGRDEATVSGVAKRSKVAPAPVSG